MIIVNATIEPKEGKTEEIIEKADVLLKASREHEGNISYNLFKNVEDGFLFFVEQWESKEALQKHMQTTEFIEFGQSTKDLISGELGIKLFTAELLSE
ncbi:MAG: hypothetical protein BZ135_00190 [Methanosphaera sp. rholeuAM6]|nr:MAG: hypothetical protein BZ135_00190 [Methanosphaera sp. rholeuAM6]